MNKNSQVSGFVSFVAIIALTSAPLLASAGSGMTTADLALQLARAAGITLTPVDSPRAALESLAKAGIPLGNDLKAPVTEKVLAEVGRALGVKVTTSRPDGAVTPAMSSAFIALFKGEIHSAAAAGSGKGGSGEVHASCQGRESRAGREGTPASPSDPNASAGPCDDPASKP